jgi:hypothetical protein
MDMKQRILPMKTKTGNKRKNAHIGLHVVAHSYNPSTREAEAEGP